MGYCRYTSASWRGETVTVAMCDRFAKLSAATNIELAINCSVLLADMVEIGGVFRWNVTRMRLAVAD
jgi:hypothetical protein